MRGSKLSPEDREELIRLLRMNQRPGYDSALAKRFGISRQRVSQLKWSTVGDPRVEPELPQGQPGSSIPYRTLKESPIQVGDYCIEVTRFYRNDGSRTNYLGPSLAQCILRMFEVGARRGETFKWARSADYAREFVEKLWTYLHVTYGEQIFPGYYPCDDQELIESATWTFSEMLEEEEGREYETQATPKDDRG